MYINFAGKICKVTELKGRQLHSHNTPHSVHAASSCWLPTSYDTVLLEFQVSLRRINKVFDLNSLINCQH